MGRQYTTEEKIKAVQLYEKLKHITWVMTELGYPSSRTLLYMWISQYHEKGIEGLDHKSKYTAEQRKAAIDYYIANGMNAQATIAALGYPGKTVLNEWLNEDLPEEFQKWRCNKSKKVVRYTKEQKVKAVTLYCAGKKPKEIGERLSVRPESIRDWTEQMLGKEKNALKKSYETMDPVKPGQTPDDLKKTISDLEAKRLELEKEVHRLQLQKDILEKADEILKKEKGIRLDEISNKEKAELIDALRDKYQLKELLSELRLSKSSYCYQHSASHAPDKYLDLRAQINDIFNENYMSYGYRRIYGVLKQKGIIVSEKVVRRLMKEAGLIIQIKEQKKYNSYKGELTPEVPNLLQRNFHADSPNQKWLTDITEFRIPAGKVYLSPMIDCFDGCAVSWTIGTSPDAELVNRMLNDAASTLSENEHPVVHTDRGCHYRWPSWIHLMETFQLTRSMSRKACSPDNSACEGFFGRLKNELFYGRSWLGVSIEEFIDTINTYICWYNEKRIKQSLGYLSPLEYRKVRGCK